VDKTKIHGSLTKTGSRLRALAGSRAARWRFARLIAAGVYETQPKRIKNLEITK
jgi:hypothetical protein